LGGSEGLARLAAAPRQATRSLLARARVVPTPAPDRARRDRSPLGRFPDRRQVPDRTPRLAGFRMRSQANTRLAFRGQRARGPLCGLHLAGEVTSATSSVIASSAIADSVRRTFCAPLGAPPRSLSMWATSASAWRRLRSRKGRSHSLRPSTSTSRPGGRGRCSSCWSGPPAGDTWSRWRRRHRPSRGATPPVAQAVVLVDRARRLRALRTCPCGSTRTSTTSRQDNPLRRFILGPMADRPPGR